MFWDCYRKIGKFDLVFFAFRVFLEGEKFLILEMTFQVIEIYHFYKNLLGCYFVFIKKEFD